MNPPAKPTYRQLAARLAEARAVIDSIRNGQADAVVGQSQVMLLRLRETEEALRIHQADIELQNDELIRARAQLAEALTRYHDLYEFAPVGYLTLDANGRITQANLAAARLCGCDRARLFCQGLESLLPPEDRDACTRCLQRTTVAAPQSCEGRLLTAAPPPRWVHIDSAVLVAPATGATVCYRLTMTDITTRKQAEAALISANEELEQRVAERTGELSLMVDDLRQEVMRRRLAESALQQRSEQLRALATQLTLAEQRERRRLAAILHDSLQQLLVAAKYRLDETNPADQTDVEHIVAEVQEILNDSLQCSRSLTHELSPSVLQHGGLGAALNWLGNWMRQKHEFVVLVEADEDDDALDEDVKVLLFQSARELLFNAFKHAQVDSARVALRQTGAQVELIVADEGVGFDPDQVTPAAGEGGFGLLSISERLDLLDGRLEVASAPGQGSRFRMIVPLPAAAAGP